MGMPKENGTSEEKDDSINGETTTTNGTVDEGAKNVSNMFII